MTAKDEKKKGYADAIRESGLSIYDSIEMGTQNLWIPTSDLEALLNEGLVGIQLSGLPLRTRSKVVKQRICQTLGYPVPLSFRRTKPRFPGQDFDTYVQKSDNLQIWNEELAPNRRYVIVRVNRDGLISRVKVVTGATLAVLDTTGTLTQKYQARLVPGELTAELVAQEDTELLRAIVDADFDPSPIANPLSHPVAGQLLPIREIFDRLRGLVGTDFADRGYDQERNRGAELHRRVCLQLGYSVYQDDGRFPDVRHQLLEVKLQTSPTIDLGLILPNSMETIDLPQNAGQQIRYCDTRYALFCAKIDEGRVALTHLLVTTGERFFERFPKFQGRVLNKKLQIKLPVDFFDV